MKTPGAEPGASRVRTASSLGQRKSRLALQLIQHVKDRLAERPPVSRTARNGEQRLVVAAEAVQPRPVAAQGPDRAGEGFGGGGREGKDDRIPAVTVPAKLWK